MESDWPEQLAVRVSRCYYELGMTQQAIAAELGMTRSRVIRLLAESRQNGLVTITIHSPLLENIELAERLMDRFSLNRCEVCLSNADDERMLASQVSGAACDLVSRLLADGVTIGLGWGVTLQAFAERLRPMPLENAAVVALLGSLTRRSSMTRFEASTALAAKLDAECLYLPAPIVCSTVESRQAIIAQPLFREIQQRALQADLALVSIGGLDSSTIRAVGLVDDSEVESVREAGAIGNFLGYFIDHRAAIVPHPINERIIGIDGATFKDIPERIMISAGENKVDAMRAVLEQGLPTGLVTDDATARALLEQKPTPAA